jgi:cbb3-type cytochrome oxidase subunit 3
MILPSFETLQYSVAAWGSAYFALLFTLALAYALLPSKRQTFEDAARIPLDKD